LGICDVKVLDGDPPFQGRIPTSFILRSGSVLAVIVPDAAWPGMWRVSAGGQVSDMVNVARVRDAAIAFAERAGRDPRTFRWTPTTATAGLTHRGKSARASPSFRSIRVEGGRHT
jgi:hypothetical protein